MVAKVSSGMAIRWECPHTKADGSLVCQLMSVDQPGPLMCWNARCIYQYIQLQIKYLLTINYNRARVNLCEKFRDDPTLDEYRKGENLPGSITGLILKGAWLRIQVRIK